MEKTTEQPGVHRHLEQKSLAELLRVINSEDQTVPQAVARALPQLETLAAATLKSLQAGGRLFYLGAGTSGRLGILDASECPPTYGVPDELVTGIIAGGDSAIRKAVEFAEDDSEQGWLDLQNHGIKPGDVAVGLAASGTTPYVHGALAKARTQGVLTACIVCNAGSPVASVSDYPVEIIVGPEVITGSTRMKAGTAQKLALNMLTTSVMVKLGRVVDNRMVDMALSNDKLWMRGIAMLQEKFDVSAAEARSLLEQHGSVRAAGKVLDGKNDGQ